MTHVLLAGSVLSVFRQDVRFMGLPCQNVNPCERPDAISTIGARIPPRPLPAQTPCPTRDLRGLAIRRPPPAAHHPALIAISRPGTGTAGSFVEACRSRPSPQKG